MIKITVRGKQYTVVSFSTEVVIVKKRFILPDIKELQTVVYVYDRERLPLKF